MIGLLVWLLPELVPVLPGCCGVLCGAGIVPAALRSVQVTCVACVVQGDVHMLVSNQSSRCGVGGISGIAVGTPRQGRLSRNQEVH